MTPAAWNCGCTRKAKSTPSYSACVSECACIKCRCAAATFKCSVDSLNPVSCLQSGLRFPVTWPSRQQGVAQHEAKNIPLLDPLIICSAGLVVFFLFLFFLIQELWYQVILCTSNLNVVLLALVLKWVSGVHITIQCLFFLVRLSRASLPLISFSVKMNY